MLRSIELGGLVDPRLVAFFTAVLLAVLNACASKPPEQPDNLCAVFSEKGGWYKHARAAEERWGLPIPVGMAFIHKESSYQSDARPERTSVWHPANPAPGFLAWCRPQAKAPRLGAGHRFFRPSEGKLARWPGSLAGGCLT